jgi:hypothetical protein
LATRISHWGDYYGATSQNTKATHKFTGLHESGRHGGEITIGDGVFIAVVVVVVVVGYLSLSLAA